MCSHLFFPVVVHTVLVGTEERRPADSAPPAQLLKAVEEIEKGVCWSGKLAVRTSEAPLRCTVQWRVDWFAKAAEERSAAGLTKAATPVVHLVAPSKVVGSQMDSEDRRNLKGLQHG